MHIDLGRLGRFNLIAPAVNATQQSEASLHLIREPPTNNDDAPPPLSPETSQGLLGGLYRRKNRGRSEELLAANQGAVDLVQCYGDDQLAEQVTITCQVRRKGDITATTLADIPAVVGLLSWGNDGFQSQAEIDFVNGTQISVAGSFVSLAAQIDADAPNNGGDNMPPVVVGAHIGYLPPVRPSVYRTRYFALDAAGGAAPSLTFAIPPFSHHVEALRSVPSLLVEVLDRAGAVMAAVSSIGPINLPLPNDARAVRVTNLELVASAGRLVFPLWL